MENYIPTFTDITDWEKLPFINTGGTRSKKIYIHPENETDYFFKGSKKLLDNTFRYPMEFWSEIASSKIGQWLGFNMLDYNIGFDSAGLQKVGCLSKSMVGNKQNTLTEGIEYLRGFDSKYDPEKHKDDYTIAFIFDSLNRFGLDEHKDSFVDMLIFDAIIGNSDRHQENWGIITDYHSAMKEVLLELEKQNSRWGKFKFKIKRFLIETTNYNDLLESKEKNKRSKTTLNNQTFVPNRLFSPIYDSGCCLAREFEDERIAEYLNEEAKIKKYISGGKSEVRIKQGKKTPHKDMLYFLKLNHANVVKKNQERINSKFNTDSLKKMIFNLDKNLPEQLNEYKLSDNRKELMLNLITLRIENFLGL